VLIEGTLRFDEFIDAWRLAARRISELDRLREQQARRLVVTWPDAAPPSQTNRLAELLEPWRPGSCEVAVRYSAREAVGALTLGPEWQVRATRELIDQLESFAGRRVRVLYAPAASAERLADRSGRP
jgi:DNA polymerase-3 subunit alpha